MAFLSFVFIGDGGHDGVTTVVALELSKDSGALEGETVVVIELEAMDEAGEIEDIIVFVWDVPGIDDSIVVVWEAAPAILTAVPCGQSNSVPFDPFEHVEVSS